MNGKLFWWGPMDPTGANQSQLWFVMEGGSATIEYDSRYGSNSISNLLSKGYVEISWQSAQAMGAPI